MESNLKEMLIGIIFGILVVYIGVAEAANLPMPNFLNAQREPCILCLTQIILFIPVVGAGRRFIFSGIYMLFKGCPNMNSLSSLSICSAILYSLYKSFLLFLQKSADTNELYFATAAAIASFVLIGKYLEDKSKNRPKSKILDLEELMPDTVSVMRNGRKEAINFKDIKKGDILICGPGEKIGADGEVEGGEAEIDESVMSGDSMPVFKSNGSYVTAGTLCRAGYLKIRAKKVGNSTQVAKIIDLCRTAKENKEYTKRISDRVSRVFVPLALASALLSGLVWLIIGNDIGFAAEIFLSVLIVSCPGAIGIAVPVVMRATAIAGARRGILYRGGSIIETLSYTDTVIFGKIGVITEGRLSVSYINTKGDMDEDTLLRYAVSAGKNSIHPAFVAMAQYALGKNIEAKEADKLINLCGGILAELDGHEIIIGTKRLMLKRGIDITAVQEEENSAYKVFIVRDGVLAGEMGFGDMLRKNFPQSVASLNDQLVDCMVMTNAKEEEASKSAQKADISEIIVGASPNEKLEKVQELKKSGSVIAIIGDGIVDAPALIAADTAACIFGATDITAEISGVILMRDDLELFADSIRLSRLSMSAIKKNFYWLFLYNLLCIPLAAGLLAKYGLFLTPHITITMSILTSAVVIVGSYRIKRLNLGK